MHNDAGYIPGSRWFKFDCHVHTPASHDYGRGDESQKTISPKDWVRTAMEAGLDCVVIADHNSGDWIDKLQTENRNIGRMEQKPAWYKDLTLFPGVELTVSDSSSRVHLLAVFDPSQDSRKITAVLGACGINEGFGDAEQTSSARGFSDVVKAITDAGGIAVPAHIDGPKGLLENVATLTPETEKSLERISGAEFCDIHKFDAIGCPNLRKAVDRLAKLAGSDAHTPEEIGKHTSWIKMNNPDIDGLTLALMDHEFCVKNQVEDPNGPPDIYLSRLTISDMAHCGRIAPMVLSLHPHFNAMIGGRGTGKSTLLESLRIAARRENELDAFTKLKEELQRFTQGQNGPKKSRGVMLENTEILLEIQRRGETFQLRWRNDGAGEVLEQNIQGNWQAVDIGDLTHRFPIKIYSQKQIHELASNPRGLLEIIDHAPGVNRREWDRRWEDKKSEFFQSMEQYRTLLRKLSEASQIRTRLKDVENDLKQYEDKGHGEILKAYQKRSQQKGSLPGDQVFDSLCTGLKSLAETAVLPDFQEELFDKNDSAVEALRSIHEATALELEAVETALVGLADKVEALKKKRNRQIKESSWNRSLNACVQTYQDLVKEYEEKESRISISLYGDWVRERNRLQGQLKSLEAIQKEKEALKSKIEACLATFLDLRRELIEKRQTFIQEVIGTSAYVRMELVPFGDINGVEEEYREILGLEEPRFKNDIYDPGEGRGILNALHNWEAP